MTVSDEFRDSLESLKALNESGQNPFGQLLSRKQLLVDDFRKSYQQQLNSNKPSLRETATRIANETPTPFSLWVIPPLITSLKTRT